MHILLAHSGFSQPMSFFWATLGALEVMSFLVDAVFFNNCGAWVMGACKSTPFLTASPVAVVFNFDFLAHSGFSQPISFFCVTSTSLCFSFGFGSSSDPSLLPFFGNWGACVMGACKSTPFLTASPVAVLRRVFFWAHWRRFRLESLTRRSLLVFITTI